MHRALPHNRGTDGLVEAASFKCTHSCTARTDGLAVGSGATAIRISPWMLTAIAWRDSTIGVHRGSEALRKIGKRRGRSSQPLVFIFETLDRRQAIVESRIEDFVAQAADSRRVMREVARRGPLAGDIELLSPPACRAPEPAAAEAPSIQLSPRQSRTGSQQALRPA